MTLFSTKNGWLRPPKSSEQKWQAMELNLCRLLCRMLCRTAGRSRGRSLISTHKNYQPKVAMEHEDNVSPTSSYGSNLAAGLDVARYYLSKSVRDSTKQQVTVSTISRALRNSTKLIFLHVGYIVRSSLRDLAFILPRK